MQVLRLVGHRPVDGALAGTCLKADVTPVGSTGQPRWIWSRVDWLVAPQAEGAGRGAQQHTFTQ